MPQPQQQGGMGTLDHNVLSQMFDNVNNNLKGQGSTTTAAMDPTRAAAAAVASKLFPQGSSSRKPGCDNFTDLVSQLSSILAKKKNRAKVTIKQVVGGHVMAQTVLEKDKLKPVTCKTTLGSPRSIDTAYCTDEASPGSQQLKSGIPPQETLGVYLHVEVWEKVKRRQTSAAEPGVHFLVHAATNLHSETGGE